MYEPLLNKVIEKSTGPYFRLFEVESATRFYLKYKSDPEKFLYEEPKFYKEFKDGLTKSGKWKTFFEYCFWDVMK